MSSSAHTSNFDDLETKAKNELRNFIGNKITSDCDSQVLYNIDLTAATNDEKFFVRFDNICPNAKYDAWKARNLPFYRTELQEDIKLLYTILLSNHNPENKGTTSDSDDTTNESAETQYESGDTVYKKKINKQNPFKSGCSDYYVAVNIDDEAPFNKAMQAVTGIQDDEYYIDFRKGGSVRAFPGFIIVDKINSFEESVYFSDNFQAIRQMALKLKQELVNTDCDDLKVYIVAANALKSNNVAGEDKPIAVFSTTAAAAGGLIGVAAGSSWVPIVGWGVAGVSALAAGLISLWPSSIANIESVNIIERLD
ncbi:MAG: hypothetical protein J6R99_04400 [Alphaproteobacteria bacterium]|nr:hypothetical protein [Alphaproteobacteria bacterium]